MRLHALALGCIVALAACGSSGSDAPVLASATPAYGPLVGGTVISIAGVGFGPDDRVLVAGREAPLVHAIDSATLEVVIPPGAQPGPAEVVVIGERGRASAIDMFRYSERPTISSVSPTDVVFDATATTVTVTGSGFLDEGAGEATVLVGGQPAYYVRVVDDSTLTFTASPGHVFTRPDLEIANLRGSAIRRRAVRYTPSDHRGLLLFPRWGATFLTFFDLVDQSSFVVPLLNASAGGPRLSSVVRDAHGDYWGMDVTNHLGSLDLGTQTNTGLSALVSRIPAMTRVGSVVYAIMRPGGTGSFGTLDLENGRFSAINAGPIACCGSYALASDGTTVWFTSRTTSSTLVLNTIDRQTGAVGAAPVTVGLPVGHRVEEMRYVDGVLYAAPTSGGLVTIDPSTGAVTPVLAGGERFHAMEAFE